MSSIILDQGERQSRARQQQCHARSTTDVTVRSALRKISSADEWLAAHNIQDEEGSDSNESEGRRGKEQSRSERRHAGKVGLLFFGAGHGNCRRGQTASKGMNRDPHLGSFTLLRPTPSYHPSLIPPLQTPPSASLQPLPTARAGFASHLPPTPLQSAWPPGARRG
eukprot:8551649-Pyramimonas_sp.AAC.1